jgi:hypothetical protein
MFRTTKIYTVHENAEIAEPSERLELVREGFSVWAFFLSALWLLANRLWIPFFIYTALVMIAVEAQRRLGLSEMTIGAIQLAMQVLLGFSAHDIQRWALERRGYRMTDVVVADTELLATQRAYHYSAA